MFVEPNTNRTDKIQQNTLRIQESSFSEIFLGQKSNCSAELKQQFSEGFSSEQTQAENERLRLHIDDDLKMQFNFYENKNWNKIIW